jgi:hypothetical protein
MLGPRGRVEKRNARKGQIRNSQKKGKWREPKSKRRGTYQIETSCTAYQVRQEIKLSKSDEAE